MTNFELALVETSALTDRQTATAVRLARTGREAVRQYLLGLDSLTDRQVARLAGLVR